MVSIFEALTCSCLSVEIADDICKSSVSGILVIRNSSADVIELNIDLCNSLIQVCRLFLCLQRDPTRSLLYHRLVGLTAVHYRISHQGNETDIALSCVRHDHASTLSCVLPRCSLGILSLNKLPLARSVQCLAPAANNRAIALHEGNGQVSR